MRPNYRQPHNISEKTGITAPNPLLYGRYVERHHAEEKQEARFPRRNGNSNNGLVSRTRKYNRSKQPKRLPKDY